MAWVACFHEIVLDLFFANTGKYGELQYFVRWAKLKKAQFRYSKSRFYYRFSEKCCEKKSFISVCCAFQFVWTGHYLFAIASV